MARYESAKQAQEPKVRFIEWFADACNGRFDKLKPHHMNEIRAYFIYLGISDPATISDYDAGMEKFGFKKANKGEN